MHRDDKYKKQMLYKYICFLRLYYMIKCFFC